MRSSTPYALRQSRRGHPSRLTPEQREFISDKIRILVREGRPQRQAIAIAYRMAGVPRPSASTARRDHELPPASERFVFPSREGADIFEHRLRAAGYKPRRVSPALVVVRAPDTATRQALSHVRAYARDPSRRDRDAKSDAKILAELAPLPQEDIDLIVKMTRLQAKLLEESGKHDRALKARRLVSLIEKHYPRGRRRTLNDQGSPHGRDSRSAARTARRR